MKGQRENGKYVQAQSSGEGYTVSRSYLAEVMKDREWETRYRREQDSDTAHESHEDFSWQGEKPEKP